MRREPPVRGGEGHFGMEDKENIDAAHRKACHELSMSRALLKALKYNLRAFKVFVCTVF